jgi:glycosyltransferase involved in cell wall biosynthesis
MSSESYPKVSFIMPTRNAAGILENCLQSIQRQDYPADRMEILISDGGSTDATREIARKYGANVMDDNGLDMEDAKRVALAKATGDYVVFVDADNEITHPDYVRLAVDGLSKNPKALGVESYYLPSPKMTSFCVYLTHLLHISDPVAWMMTVNPVFLGAKGDFERWTVPENSYAYPLGANGFVYRRADLLAVQAAQQFSDTHVALYLMKSGKKEWLRIKGRGGHQYYVANLREFLKKRQRSTVHFMNMYKKFKFNWSKQSPPVPGWLACLYCVSVIGPLYHTVRGVIKTGDLRWCWHPLASVVSALGVAWGVKTHFFHSHEKDIVSKLQPIQKLDKK